MKRRIRQMICCRARRLFALLLSGLALAVFTKTFLSVKQLLGVNTFRFFQYDRFGALRGQALIDYISANLVVEYVKLDDNVFIALTNNGTAEIPGDEDWSLFFNHADGLADVARRGTKVIESSRIVIRHHNGWFYSMGPLKAESANTSFAPLKPNQTIVVHESPGLKSKSYSFPNWYVSGRGLEAKIVLSTHRKRPRTGFQLERWSAKDRFNRNNVAGAKRSAKTIIPTPLYVKKLDEEMKIDRNWRVAYNRDFQSEGKFLAAKLRIMTVEDVGLTEPLLKTIHLAVEHLGSEFAQFDRSKRLHVDEGYKLTVTANTVRICGSTAHGIFNGIQSLLSLLENSEDRSALPLVEILDAPRFPYRGLMYDAARNFVDKEEIMLTVSLMATYKLNKLHLHLTDDQGWRIEIPTLPELTEIGSRRGHDLSEERSLLPYFGFGPTQDASDPKYYSVADYKEILRHAAIHHVEVIPEFDMPAHAHAAVQSMRRRYFRMKQQQQQRQQEGGSGGEEDGAESRFLLHDFNDTSWYLGVNEQMDTVMNPCMESTYAFVKEIIRSLVSIHEDVQPLKTLHVGGDEVPQGALVKSPLCNALTKRMPELAGNLKFYFMKRVISIANEFEVRVQTWEDGLGRWGDPAFNASEWKNAAGITVNAWELSNAAYNFANKGYQVVLTHAHRLYLDHPYEPDGEENGLHWATRNIDSRNMFEFAFSGDLGSRLNSTFSLGESCRVLGLKNCNGLQSPENIIGMQASLWGEMIQSNDAFEYMLCPRLLAFAERAWHLADWETASSEKAMVDGREEDWAEFAKALGQKELRRLERLGVRYRISVPGFRITDKNLVELNSEFPGSLLQYSRDGGKTWNAYTEGNPLERSGNLSFSVASYDLQRRGRIVDLASH